VVSAIHLDDQPRFRSEEVGDVTAEHRLPPKAHPELPAAERFPEASLRVGGGEAMNARAIREFERATV